MKKIFLIILLLISLLSFSQAQLGMSIYFPVVKSYTVPYSSTITANCYVKNTGTANFVGSFTIHIDTLNFTGQDIATIPINNVVVPLGDSIFVPVTFSITPQFFKAGGGGTVIIIWPKITGGTTTDTLNLHVYINTTANIQEYEQQPYYLAPNPSSDKLILKTHSPELLMKEIVIYNFVNQEVKRFNNELELDISELSKGFYWLRIMTKNKNYSLLFIKE